MTTTQYRRRNGEWYKGRKGTALVDIKNNAGQVIKAGEEITFYGKSGRGGFNIMSATVSINAVDYQKIYFVE